MTALGYGNTLIESGGRSRLKEQAGAAVAEARTGNTGNSQVPQPVGPCQIVFVEAETGFGAPVRCDVSKGPGDIVGNAGLCLRVGEDYSGREPVRPARR